MQRTPGAVQNTVRHDEAFSLIELLAVIAIMLIVTVLFWAPKGKSRTQQLKAACKSNLEKMYLALEVYANESAGRFPIWSNAQRSEEALSILVPRYTSDTAVFTCPGSKDPALPAAEPFLKRKISYAYYMGCSSTNSQALVSDEQANTVSRPGAFAFSTDGKPPGNNHGKTGGNFLFCDGHIESSGAKVPFGLAPSAGIVLLNP